MTIRKTLGFTLFLPVVPFLLPPAKKKGDESEHDRRFTGDGNGWAKLRQATVGEDDLGDGLWAAGDGGRHAGHACRHEQRHDDIDVGGFGVLILRGSMHVAWGSSRKTMVVESRTEKT
jgi:hypothetical protein